MRQNPVKFCRINRQRRAFAVAIFALMTRVQDKDVAPRGSMGMGFGDMRYEIGDKRWVLLVFGIGLLSL